MHKEIPRYAVGEGKPWSASTQPTQGWSFVRLAKPRRTLGRSQTKHLVLVTQVPRARVDCTRVPSPPLAARWPSKKVASENLILNQ
ncbi:hypothetical protein CEXT_101951 [Caerostris extrusa]|uniref:Uncharacterized protein n=1 Tax=Caerostris extrusa TaxID=172846 RepID=A0AAV4YAR6_CAEEX|nr:hypothetical protein CEXT_101951 [Caerostris extrusa]